MSIKLNSNLDANSIAKVVNLPTPTSSGDAVPKSYVDGLKAGLDWKDSVRVASLGSNVSISSAPASLDGVTLAANDRILLKDQSAPAENGIYVFSAAASALTRSTDGAAGNLTGGAAVPVNEGTTNADTIWLLTTNDPITVGSTSLAWSQLGATYTAGTGITKTGNQFSLTSPVTVALGGTNASTAAAARTNLGATGKYAQDIGDGSTLAIAVTHGLGTTDIVAMVFNKGTGAMETVDITATSTTVATFTFVSAPATNSLRVIVIG